MGFERNNKIIIKTLIVVIIALVIFAGLIVLVNNPKFKIKAAVKYMFNQADSSLESAKKSAITNAYENNKINIASKITAQISLSDDILNLLGYNGKNIQDLINNSTIETNINADMINKYVDMAMDYSYGNEKLSLNTYIDNNQTYVYLKDLYSKYIKIGQNDVNMNQIFTETTTNISIDEISYLMDILKKSIVSSLEYGKYNTTKADIDIDGEKVSVNKTTLTIDTEFDNKINLALIDNVLYDDKAKGILIKLVDRNKYPDIAALEADIRSKLLKIQSTTYDNKVLGEYSLYTTGLLNDVVRNEFKSFDNENVVIQYTTYKASKFDTQICLYNNNELVGEANIKEASGDNYDITLTFGSDMSMDIRGVIKEKLIDVNYTLRISGMDDFRGYFKSEIKKSNKNEVSGTSTFNLDTPESYGTINLTMDSTIKKIDNITKPDFSNSVDMDKMTTQDVNNIITGAKIKYLGFLRALDNILGTSFSAPYKISIPKIYY